MTVETLVYPRYETKGDLGDTVSRFRSWYAPFVTLAHTALAVEVKMLMKHIGWKKK